MLLLERRKTEKWGESRYEQRLRNNFKATWKSQRLMCGFNSNKQLVDATNGFQTDGKCPICIEDLGRRKTATLLYWCFYTNILRAKYSSKPFNHRFLNRLQSLTCKLTAPRSKCLYPDFMSLQYTAHSTLMFTNPGCDCFMPKDTDRMRGKRSNETNLHWMKQALACCFYFTFESGYFSVSWQVFRVSLSRGVTLVSAAA